MPLFSELNLTPPPGFYGKALVLLFILFCFTVHSNRGMSSKEGHCNVFSPIRAHTTHTYSTHTLTNRKVNYLIIHFPLG